MKIGLSYGSGIVTVLVLLVSTASAQGNYANNFSVSAQELLVGVDAATIQQLNQATSVLQRNPNDVNALVSRAAISLNIADKSRYAFHWVHFAATDLEKAIRLDPNNFYARHNYAMACYQAGDDSDTQPNMHLAIIQFTKAIQIKPDSARSYMGRGWAYLMLDDEAHANADFQAALRLDQSLRAQLVRIADGIRQKRGQKGCVQATLQRMGSYTVIRTARTYYQCTAVKGYWTDGECRMATLALNQESMAALAHSNCVAPPDAVDDRYNDHAGGRFVR